jgi:hypothetical protein
MSLRSLANSSALFPVIAYVIGCSGTAVALLLLVNHAETIREMRDHSLPAAAAVPALQRRVDGLKGQIDAAELQEAMSGGQAEEAVRAFALPSGNGIDRPLASLELITTFLRQRGAISHLSAITRGESAERTITAPDGTTLRDVVIPLTLSFDATDEGLRIFLDWIDLQGSVTVSDVLRPEERQILLDRVQEENPAGIVVLEHFFATDLLDAVQNAARVDSAVTGSFSSDAFLTAFADTIGHSGLRRARDLLRDGLGDSLQERSLWPGRFLSIAHLETDVAGNGQIRVSATLLAHGRP